MMNANEMIMFFVDQCRWRASPARNASMSGQLLKSGGRS